MSNIVYNLKKFFNEQQDEAAIPGLGIFFKTTADETGNPLPEGHSVILFVEKAPRSNAFVNFFGYEENLTENEAVEIIEQWVSGILNDLKNDKIAFIPELGTFEIKKDKVIFVPATDQNSPQEASDRYGLGDEIPKVKESEQTKKATEKTISEKEGQPMNRAVLWSIIGAIVVVLIGAFIILGGLDIFQSRPAQPIVIGPATVAEIDDEISTEDLGMQIAQLRYAVIGGSFCDRANAEAFLARMRSQGYNAELIFCGDIQRHRVALGSFKTRAEAVEFMNRVRSTTPIRTAWILER
ncbi:MAG: SPOR domain-containing protein [Bacteroidales bacterium]|nr:SPOR domain-containing protein [Bacteroidales bacterium]